MKFVMPKEMPLKYEFTDLVFSSILGERDDGSGYAYRKAFTSFYEEFFHNVSIDEKDDLVRYAKEVDFFFKRLYKRESAIDDDTIGDCIDMVDMMSKLCYDQKNILNWLAKKDLSHFNNSEKMAIILPYLVLKGPSCYETKVNFFKKCFEYLGIEEMGSAVEEIIFKFDWGEGTDEKWITCGERIDIFKLTNKPIIICGLAAAVVIKSIGYSVVDPTGKAPNIVERFQEKFKDFFATERRTQMAVAYTQKALFDNVKYFEPRSIITGNDTLFPEEYYIPSDFKNYDGERVSPIFGLDSAERSLRSLIVAKTGFGKSAFLQMLTLSMLCDSIDKDTLSDTDKARLPAIRKMGEKLGAPKGKVVISVPAKMFSSMYGKHPSIDRCDFVELFLYCLWNLNGKYNYYSKDFDNPRVISDGAYKNFQYEEDTKKYIDALARQGKLVLLLDSFDEITHGDMRTKYLASISTFYDKYCCYGEPNAVGAHIIMTSRDMSPETMEAIELRLAVSDNRKRFRILPLSDTGKDEIIRRWCGEGQQAEEMKAVIRNNHFYKDYSVNPYMLSVVCKGQSLSSVTTDLIDTLVKRMQTNNKKADIEVQSVFMHITEILEEVAIETILDGNPHFSKELLGKNLKKHIDTMCLTEEQIEEYLEMLHGIFVTEVGLIVPADGEDHAYQFINNQIRYELASVGFKRFIPGNKTGYVAMLGRAKDITEYTGFIVPLICSLKTQPQISGELIKELIVCDYKEQSDGEKLMEAMIDLVTSRYGENIATVLVPGEDVKETVYNVQRLLMMRILSSSCFDPKEIEKKAIAESAAFVNSQSWLSDAIKKSIV